MDSLTNRVCRLVSGGFNTLISIAENSAPEMVMEEAIREIDSAMDEVRSELGSVIAKKHLAKTRLNAETNKHADLAMKIGLAVSEKRDDLAETAISRQLDIEALFPVLNANIDDVQSP